MRRFLNAALRKRRSVVADKKFALAGKLFEYIFEPAVYANSKFFYDARFHVFIANTLYAAWQAKPETAGALLKAFQESMRGLDQKHLESLATVFTGSEDKNSPQSLVLRFARANKEAIRAEMEDLGSENPAGRWVLDLSATCLDGLLASWGGIPRRHEGNLRLVEAPTRDAGIVCMAKVGYSGEKRYIEIGGVRKRKLLTYSLAEFANFIRQVASIPGTAACGRGRLGDFLCDEEPGIEKKLIPGYKRLTTAQHCSRHTILPDANNASLSSLDGLLNSMLLIELCEESRKWETAARWSRTSICKSPTRAAGLHEKKMRVCSAASISEQICLVGTVPPQTERLFDQFEKSNGYRPLGNSQLAEAAI